MTAATFFATSNVFKKRNVETMSCNCIALKWKDRMAVMEAANVCSPSLKRQNKINQIRYM